MLDRELNTARQTPIFGRQDATPAGWAVSTGQIAYPDAVTAMEARAAEIAEGRAGELIWLLEHPPLYTAGVSAKPGDLLEPDRFPVRAFVAALETWVIGALARFNVVGEVRTGRVGVWVERRAPGLAPREDKIAAIGVKLRRWVSFHGISLNVEPDLGHFSGIVPCGVTEHGVTSLVDLGLPVTMDEADEALRASFEGVFGPVETVPPPLDGEAKASRPWPTA
jgi:lipoyl(octanoyl) transferase